MKKGRKTVLYNKYTRAMIVIVVGIIVLAGANFYQKSELKSQVTLEKVLKVSADVLPYGEITTDNTEVVDMVKSEIPENALRSQGELKKGDTFASSIGFTKGDVVRSSYITTAEQSKLGSSVSLKKGMVEVAVKVDLVTAGGGEVKEGTLVDAFIYVKDERTNQSSTISPETLKKLLVKKIVNTEGHEPDGESNTNLVPAAIVLEANAQQALALVKYQNEGTIHLLPTSKLVK